jgi:signal transduction histidine kinase
LHEHRISASIGFMADSFTTLTGGRVIGWGPVSATIVAGTFAALSWLPKWDDEFLLGVLYVLVVASFAATGAFLLTDGRTGRLGWGMIAAAFCYAVSWWWIWPQHWQVGPAPLISFVLGYGWFVVGGLALVRYPEPALRRRHEQVYFGALAIWVIGGKLAVAAVSLPEWKRWNADAWWPTLVADRRLSETVSSVVGLGITVLALFLPVLLLYRVRHSRGVERSDLLPATAAAVSIGVFGGLYLVAVNLHVTGGVTDSLRDLSVLAALVAPIAFIVSLVQRRIRRGLGADDFRLLSRCDTIEQMQSALRRLLDDQSLILAVRSASPASLLPASGPSMDLSEDTRWQVDVPGRNGRPIGVLLLDPTLRRRENAVRTAAVACGIALNDGVLQHFLTDQLEQSQTSRRRLTHDSLKELQRIGHELHDGVNATLQAVQAHLARIRIILRRHETGPDQTAELDDAVNWAQATAQVAIDELRDLSRGFHPEVLEEGLRPALRRKFDRIPLPLTLDIDERRTRPEVELIMYLLVSEAVNNALKHAHATRVTVTTTITDRVSQVRVADDGRGGVEVQPGSGLAALRERVRSLGGELTITSEAGTGTVIEGRIP